MFNINTIDIQETFVKIFSGEKDDLQSFSFSSAVNITGADSLINESISLPLSLSTTITLRITNDGYFKFINSNSDIMYQCSANGLLDYNDNKNIKNIFRAIALFKGNINGAQILFNYSSDEKCFKLPICAVAAALGIVNNNSIPSVNEINSLSNADSLQNNNIPCELFGRRNNAVYYNANGKIEYLPFNLSNYKLVLTIIDTKKDETKISEIRQKYYKEKLSSDDSNTDNSFSYEKERMKRLYRNLSAHKTVNKEFASIMKEYADILGSKFGSYGKKLYEAHVIAEDTGFTEAVIPAYEYKGLCALVDDKYVDKFIDSFTDKYIKLEGIKPLYFICNTADSGIKLNASVPITEP